MGVFIFSSLTNHSPYGCTKFGFKAKKRNLQSLLRHLAHNVHIGKHVRHNRTHATKPEESLMAGELNSV